MSIAHILLQGKNLSLREQNVFTRRELFGVLQFCSFWESWPEVGHYHLMYRRLRRRVSDGRQLGEHRCWTGRY